MTHLATMPREFPKIDQVTGLLNETTASDSLITPDGYMGFKGSLPVYDIELCESKGDKKI